MWDLLSDKYLKNLISLFVFFVQLKIFFLRFWLHKFTGFENYILNVN